MDSKNLGLVSLAVVICAVVFIGEYVTYGNVFDYDATMDSDGNYSIYDSGSHCYSAVLSDNGSFEPPSRIYLYYDESYGNVVHKVQVEVGAKALTQDYYLSQLINNLKYYSVTDVKYVNADELAVLVSNVSDAVGSGLVVISGALPSTVYQGVSTDPIFKWINAGGSLYWAGEAIGKYVGNPDGACKEVSGGDSLFTGQTDSLYLPDDMGRAYSVETSNGYRESLSLKNNVVKYSVKHEALCGEYLVAGFTEHGCSSVTMMGHGAGMVCIFGGDYSNYQRMDMATVIASGIGYSSVELDHQSGTVTRGTVTGKFADIPETHGILSAFIYCGGDFSVYGKSFMFSGA